VISTFEGCVNGLENKVQQIKADSDETAIKFAGLDFRSQKETALLGAKLQFPIITAG
jgi:hypothetical protein